MSTSVKHQSVDRVAHDKHDLDSLGFSTGINTFSRHVQVIQISCHMAPVILLGHPRIAVAEDVANELNRDAGLESIAGVFVPQAVSADAILVGQSFVEAEATGASSQVSAKSLPLPLLAITINEDELARAGFLQPEQEANADIGQRDDLGSAGLPPSFVLFVAQVCVWAEVNEGPLKLPHLDCANAGVRQEPQGLAKRLASSSDESQVFVVGGGAAWLGDFILEDSRAAVGVAVDQLLIDSPIEAAKQSSHGSRPCVLSFPRLVRVEPFRHVELAAGAHELIVGKLNEVLQVAFDVLGVVLGDVVRAYLAVKVLGVRGNKLLHGDRIGITGFVKDFHGLALWEL